LKEFYIWVGKDASDADIQSLFGVANYQSIPEDMVSAIFDTGLQQLFHYRVVLRYIVKKRYAGF
jgi:hypothetical protein